MPSRSTNASAQVSGAPPRVDRDQFALAQLAARNDRFEEARERLTALLAAAPAAAPLAAAPAAAPAAAKRAATSAAASARATAAPDARDAVLLLAEALYQAGRYDESLAVCADARRRGWLEADDPAAAVLAGWVLLRRGRARAARELAARRLRDLTRHAFGTVDPALHARLLHLRGMCDHRLGHPRPARRALRDAAALFRLRGDWAGVAEALNALGVVEKTSVGLPAAAARFAEALRLNRAHGLAGRRAQNLLNLAIVRLKMGETDAALPPLREARALAEQRGAAQTAVRARLVLARARLQADDPASAAAEARAASDEAAAGGFRREEGLALETLGDAAAAAGRHDEAGERYAGALAVARELAPGGDLEAETLRRLGELALARGDPRAAAAELRRAVRAAATCGERFEAGVAARALAMAHLELGQWSHAYRACRSALSVLREMGAALESARCLLLAARIRGAWWRAVRRHGGAQQEAAPRGHLEAAWSYAIEAFHAFDGLGRETERAACVAVMDDLRAAGGVLGGTVWGTIVGKIGATAGATTGGQTSGPSSAGAADEGRETPFVARAAASRRLLELAAMAAASDEPLLVCGETGTGKELVARLVHGRGRRAQRPFVPVNCAAIPETLFEREFFGHAKGAYTGADRDKPGLCEAADGGTLFLDEIGDLPPPMQAKLLRLLQEGTFRRLGEPRERRVDLRVIAATNADLPALIAQRRFRQDLYYRLQTLELSLPPLRERMEDIDPLIALFAGRDATLAELFEPEVLDALRAYPWPGNVRELEAMVRRLALLAKHAGRATLAMLPPPIARHATGARATGARAGLSLARHLERAERERIVEALSWHEGNRTEAARALGISRNALYKKMGRLGIQISA